MIARVPLRVELFRCLDLVVDLFSRPFVTISFLKNLLQCYCNWSSIPSNPYTMSSQPIPKISYNLGSTKYKSMFCPSLEVFSKAFPQSDVVVLVLVVFDTIEDVSVDCFLVEVVRIARVEVLSPFVWVDVVFVGNARWWCRHLDRVIEVSKKRVEVVGGKESGSEVVGPVVIDNKTNSPNLPRSTL